MGLSLKEEQGPSIFEWILAFFLFIIPFVSFFYADTAYFTLYELKFAQAILHRSIKEAYEPIVKLIAANGGEVSNVALYDLPLNLIFGIWGIPLYLYCSRSGTLVIDFPDSFWQMLYAKSILLVAFLFSAVLVYKLCRALELNEKRSGWGAFIYFTSSIATSAIGIIGQCDIFAVTLTLLGVLAYIRNKNKKFLFWFLIAAQFKQFAFFVFLPLMLLRDKNLFRCACKLILIMVATSLCNLPLISIPEALKSRAGFTAGMFMRLLQVKLPLLHEYASVFVFAFGIFCIYCWLHNYRDESDKQEVNSQIIFTALASMIILFTTFPSYPYWYVHLIPYLAIITVYNSAYTNKILLLESIGIAAVIFSNFIVYFWCYTPNNSYGMLLHKLAGSPEFVNLSEMITKVTKVFISRVPGTSLSTLLPPEVPGIITKAVIAMKFLEQVFDAVYLACMYIILWLAYPKNHLQVESCNLRPYVLLRLLLNTLVCSIPIILIFIPILRS